MGAALSMGMNFAGTALSLMGAGQAGDAKIAAGDARGAALDYRAAQLDQKAGQELASSQREAVEQRRRQKLVSSRALAVGAAGGGGVDPGLADILGDLAEEGEFRVLTSLYTGEEKAAGLRMQAGADRFEAGESRRAGRLEAQATKTAAWGQALPRFATALTDSKSLFAKYS
jgi:hypothetical protein